MRNASTTTDASAARGGARRRRRWGEGERAPGAKGSRGFAAAALVLGGALVLAGCEDIGGDSRLAACGGDVPTNRIGSTLEIPASQVVTRFGVGNAGTELNEDRPAFVVVFTGPALLKVQHGENLINRVYYDAICVWFSDREIYVYDHVSPPEAVG